MSRTILAHVNVEVPDDFPFTADQVGNEIEAAIAVARDDEPNEHVPALAAAIEIVVPLAEEV